MFKIIGYAGEGFLQEVKAAAEKVLGPLQDGRQLSSRASSGGKYLAVTLDVEVESAGQVLAVYEALRGVTGVVTMV
jgi:putative lipoic acid-binding regulatory protein